MSEPPAAARRFQGASLDALQNNDGSELHPAVRELAGKALRGGIDRRSVLRVMAWLGVSMVSARAVLGTAARGAAAGAAQPGPAGSVGSAASAAAASAAGAA